MIKSVQWAWLKFERNNDGNVRITIDTNDERVRDTYVISAPPSALSELRRVLEMLGA